MKKIKVGVIGAGERGSKYARYAQLHPEKMQIVAVAEPEQERRESFANTYNLSLEQCFTDWRYLLNTNRNSPLEQGLSTRPDAIFICTTDTLHTAPALKALEQGYDVMLEKPMSPNLDEAEQLVQATEKHNCLLQVCHVLRYTSFFQKVRDIVQSGELGSIINVTHTENLIYWHMAHSFVRGNWRNTEIAGPMILAKCCHDFDILQWIIQKPVKWLNSFGSLMLFKPENAPAFAPSRCTDGCPVSDTCKFYAPRLYLNSKSGWPFDVVTRHNDLESRLKALQTGPYGRCVYHCDNNVVDHQVVNMIYQDGATATLIMNGHGDEEGRTMRYDGTLGTLRGNFSPSGQSKLTIHNHLSGQEREIDIESASKSDWTSGHGGGDLGIVDSFIRALNGEVDSHLTTARESLESHLLAFAAEEARLSHQTIDMETFRKR